MFFEGYKKDICSCRNSYHNLNWWHPVFTCES